MKLPYFTNPDSELIRSGRGRDPLGLQPVWSAFGRELVPYLASPVTQVSGIKSILLIHWLADCPLKDFFNAEKKPSFRSFFRLMEGVLEYFLYKSPKNSVPQLCYGIRALAADANNFRVTYDDGRTAVNGLYQYYRGTCRRAGLLSSDWVVPEHISKVFNKIWTADLSQILINHLEPSLKIKGDPLYPHNILLDNKINNALKRFFQDEEINEILRQQIFKDHPYISFARECAALLTNLTEPEPSDGWIKWRIDQLYNSINNETNTAHSLCSSLQHIQKCEPFVLLLQDCFDYMAASQGSKIDTVAQEIQDLENTLSQRAQGQNNTLRKRAEAFLTLDEKNDRMRELVALAQSLLNNATFSVFLINLLNHHKKCMTDRERTPLVLEEGEILVVTETADRDKKAIIEHMDSGVPWSNDYYFSTAGTIYHQLFGGSNG
ncbi:MAG: hypothetical protein CVU71_07180 [Deltaproteobacteria bacterium HGW-Deltaproteobacteria-6]|jgi:hypothetical protein|nr:MAG: hypothetical protein CVU71_07180 [Deltaproteobacteria bacterium HGW-Deltaproteobacteria-6]